MQQDSHFRRIVFWNVNRSDLTNLVCLLAESTMADIIVLNENQVTSNEMLRALRQHVSVDFYLPRATSERRFHCFCRTRSLDASEVHSGFRTSVRDLKIGHHRALLGLVHGVDTRNYDTETRQSFAQELSSEMRFVKQQQGTNKLLMIGDFNMNPYDRGMNLAVGMNAMMTRSCVRPGFRRFLGKDYELYYNPMWSLFGDNTEGPSGTVYDTSNQGPYGWSMLDQVVINHSIVGIFEEVRILTYAGSQPLMDDRGRPDASIASDHFPIQVTLRGDGDEQLLA